jgi:hypothetical protein
MVSNPVSGQSTNVIVSVATSAFINTNPTNEPITSGLLLVTRDNRHGFRYGHIYSIDDFPGSGR